MTCSDPSKATLNRAMAFTSTTFDLSLTTNYNGRVTKIRVAVSFLAFFCTGQIDGTQLQPAEAGFVVLAEGFSPAGDVQLLFDQYIFGVFLGASLGAGLVCSVHEPSRSGDISWSGVVLGSYAVSVSVKGER